MKLLLCSDFSGVGFRFLKKFYDKTEDLNCLFINYASDEDSNLALQSSSATKFLEMGMNIYLLEKDFDFNKKIDIIFVRGGNTTRLIHYLREYNQYEKVKNLVERQGALYIGSSAGSVLVGTDTQWTLLAEPYEYDLKKLYGNEALKGFGWIDKLVFVHCNKYVVMFEKIGEKYEYFRVLDTFCYPDYLKDKKIYKRDEYLKIDNNKALLVDGEKQEMLVYHWNHLPIREYIFKD